MRCVTEAYRPPLLACGRALSPEPDLYTRKSTHIVDRIQRMQRINEIAIVIGAPIMWVLLGAVGIPYTGAIMCTASVGLLVVRRLYITKFDAPDRHVGG